VVTVSRWTRVVVIGDTPNDVAAAKAIGARAIGVTTGRYTHDELRACGADEVVASLTEIVSVD
jgi:phosphoglycolate phosphatase-like HAD superfamily hydrolase